MSFIQVKNCVCGCIIFMKMHKNVIFEKSVKQSVVKKTKKFFFSNFNLMHHIVQFNIFVLT